MMVVLNKIYFPPLLLGFLISPASAYDSEKPEWGEAGNTLTENACIIEDGNNRKLCTINISPGDEWQQWSGPGLVVDGQDGRASCTQIIAAIPTRSFIDNLDRFIQPEGGMVTQIPGHFSDGTGYELFLVNSTWFRTLECPKDYAGQLEDVSHLFYHQNHLLPSPTTLDNEWIVGYFNELTQSIDHSDYFFHFAASRDLHFNETYCDHLCAPGFAAINSMIESNYFNLTGNNGCGVKNQALEPFHNSLISEYNFVCKACDHGTYRYAFPLEKGPGSFGFKCKYDCQKMDSCLFPYKIAKAGQAVFNTLCDCPDGSSRLIITPMDIITRNVTLRENGAFLESASELTANYANYQFECLLKAGFCSPQNTTASGLPDRVIGFQFVLNDTNSSCFVETSNGILPVEGSPLNAPLRVQPSQEQGSYYPWVIAGVTVGTLLTGGLIAGITVGTVLAIYKFRQRATRRFVPVVIPPGKVASKMASNPIYQPYYSDIHSAPQDNTCNGVEEVAPASQEPIYSEIEEVVSAAQNRVYSEIREITSALKSDTFEQADDPVADPSNLIPVQSESDRISGLNTEENEYITMNQIIKASGL